MTEPIIITLTDAERLIDALADKLRAIPFESVATTGVVRHLEELKGAMMRASRLDARGPVVIPSEFHVEGQTHAEPWTPPATVAKANYRGPAVAYSATVGPDTKPFAESADSPLANAEGREGKPL